MAHLSACLATLWDRSIVLNTEHVAHSIVAVGIVHDSTCLGVHREILQSPTLRVVAIEGLGTVAVLQVAALLELVVANLLHVVVAVGLVAAHMGELSAEVVRISNLLLVGVDHLQESVMAVVGPLRHVGSDDLDFYKYTR